MKTLFLLLALISCSSSHISSMDLAYNRCATTCHQQGAKPAYYTESTCQCSPNLNHSSNQALP